VTTSGDWCFKGPDIEWASTVTSLQQERINVRNIWWHDQVSGLGWSLSEIQSQCGHCREAKNLYTCQETNSIPHCSAHSLITKVTELPQLPQNTKFFQIIKFITISRI
jgi:hypothetical protein